MRKALGRGLDALLTSAPAVPPPVAAAAVVPSPPPVAVPPTPSGPIAELPVAAIRANPDQPRKHFDESALAALAASIQRHGLLQPLVVHPVGEGYELIAGERRLRAAQRAGLDRVPVVVRDAPDRQRYELALIENLQRENLSPLEEAEAFRHLIDTYGLTQDDVAREVGRSRPAIANALRLLALPEAVKAELEAGTLTAGHARAVLQIEGVNERIQFAREITDRRLSKHDAEALAASRRATPSRKATQSLPIDPNVRALTDELTRVLGTRVRLEPRRGGRGGAIVVEYYSDAELDGLVRRFRAAARG